MIAGMDRAWATGEWWDGGRPSPADDTRHRAWWARYLRMAASPAMAQNLIRMNMGMDIRDLLPTIEQPTLILHRTGDTWIDVGHARYLAEHIPSASYVELPGSDHRPWLGDVDAIVDEVEVFVTGRKSRPRRRASIGVDALSRREREVAVLASRGQTATRDCQPSVCQQAHCGESPGQHLREARGRFQDGTDPQGFGVWDLAKSKIRFPYHYGGISAGSLLRSSKAPWFEEVEMDKTASTWSMPRELVQVVLARAAPQADGLCRADRRHRVLRHEPTRRHPPRPRNRGGLAQGRADISDSAARLQFRASVGDTTAYCPAHLTVGAMSGNPRSPPTQQVLTTVKGIWQWMKRN